MLLRDMYIFSEAIKINEQIKQDINSLQRRLSLSWKFSEHLNADAKEYQRDNCRYIFFINLEIEENVLDELNEYLDTEPNINEFLDKYKDNPELSIYNLYDYDNTLVLLIDKNKEE